MGVSMNYFLNHACFVALLWALYLVVKPSKNYVNVPTVRYSRFLPDFFNRLIFYIAAPSLINYGYKKYKNEPYRVLKADGDLIVLPARYLEELRNLPLSKLDSLDAQLENILGKYTNVLSGSHLPALTVAKRLTPALGRVLPQILDELEYAFPVEVPECDGGWVSVNPYEMILALITRATSRVIAGEALCRNDQWLETVTSYTINLGMTVILLRPFPDFLRPLVANFLPSVRRLNEQLQFVQNELFIPMIHSRKHAELNSPTYEKPDDFLQWMMDLADNDRDKEPANLAQNLLVVMSLAVVHTSTMLLTHVLFDLITMPEYLKPLREEIRNTLKNGWRNATQSSFAAQRQLDSFMRESQRHNPVGEVSTHRMVMKTLTLSDGLVLPKGTHICFPSRPMCMDPSIVENPHVFDGFRWCKDPEARMTRLVSIGPSNMHFGFGRQACPGRFFAANTTKAAISRIIAEYDFKFENGKNERPKNILNGEQIMPNMYARILIKKREMA